MKAINKQYLNLRLLGLALGVMLWFGGQAQHNVILIVADDVGTDYCGFYENYRDTVNMPNIRRLLSKGVRFQNAMSNPLCSASRAGIFTGRYSFRTGVGGAIGFGSASLDTSEMSIPRLLKINAPNVIATAQIGKWHLNTDTPATNLLIPNLMGYDYYSGNFRAGHDYYHWTKTTNGVSQVISNYATTETTNDAISWIKSQNSKPFFLWLAYNAAHIPYHLPPSGLHSYSGLSGTQEDIDQHPKLYFKAMVEAMDHEIGRLFDSLQTYNKFDSTDIIFIADNGNAPGACQSTVDSLKGKGTIYLNGNIVPVIVSGPSVVNPNRASSALMNTQDLFATILELAGDTVWRYQIPAGIQVDSKSLLPILKNTATEVRPWSFTEVFHVKGETDDGKTIRNTDYDLLHFDNGKREFYNIKNDHDEIINLLDTFLTDSDISNYNYLCDQLTTLVGDTSGCNAIISVSPAVTKVLCNDASTGKITLQVTGAVAPYTYIWNDGVITKNRSGLAVGTYTVTITDSKFQSRKLSIKISQSPKIRIQSITNQTVCGGDIVITPTGGKKPYSYLWSNHSTNSTLNNVAPGQYIVTVADYNGCTMLDSINLVNPNALSLTKSQTNVYCNSYSNGTARVIPSGGTPAYSYIWSNGQTNQTATALSSTSYTVQVTDNNGCSLKRTFNISQTNPLVSTVSKLNPSCNAGCNGSAIASVISGGTQGLTYNWSNGQSTQTITGLCAGTYAVTITNSNNCTSSNVVVIIDPPVLQGVSTVQLSCKNPGHGIAKAIVTGGTPPHSYLWSNGQTTKTTTGLSSGNYSVVVTDANGCSIQYVIPVMVSSPVFATATSANPTCSANKGSVNISVTGGKNPYQYQWNTGAITSAINNLYAGVYTVNVTDNAGCSLTVSTVLTVTGAIPNQPGNISGQKTEVCAGSANKNYSVALINNANSFLWTATANATIISGQGTNSVNINFDSLFYSGKVSVIAVNYCGSGIARAATINSDPLFPDTISGPISVCANQTNVAYSIAPVDGASTYLWTKPHGSVLVSGQGTTNIVVNFGINDGNITVKAGNTCGYSGTKSRHIAFICRESENEIGINDFNVYPNPTNDLVNISFNLNFEVSYYFELKDVMGRVVNNLIGYAQMGNNRTTMKVTNLASGLYFLSIEMNGMKTIRKIAIEKL